MKIDINDLVRRFIDVARRPVVLGSIIGGFLFVILWLLLFFVPQGKTLATLTAQIVTLKKKIATAKVQLKYLNTLSLKYKTFTKQITKLHVFVPTASNESTLLTTIRAQVSASGSKFLSYAPATPSIFAPKSASPSSASATKAKGEGIVVLPVTLTLSATYDQILSLFTHVDNSSRLLEITSVNVTGGGYGTSRSTPLTVTMTLNAYYVTKAVAAAATAAAAPTTTTTAAKK